MAPSLSSHPHGIDGKRAACDRCRQQKLRCLPGPVSSPGRRSSVCLRCHAAGASCHHSPTGRPGRPPNKPTSPSTASVTQISSTLQPSPSLQTPALPTPEDAFTPIFPLDPALPSRLDDGLDEYWGSGPDSSYVVEQSLDDCLQATDASTVEQDTGTHDVEQGPPFSSQSAWDSVPFPELGDMHVDLSSQPKDQNENSDPKHDFGTSFQLGEPALALSPRVRDASAEQQRIRSLFELNSKLQLACSATEHIDLRTSEMSLSVSSMETFAGRVLELSSELLELLASFDAAPMSHQTQTRSLNTDHIDLLASDSQQIMHSTSPASSFTMAELSLHNHTATRPLKVPTTTCLQLLASYMDIIKLHCNFYAGIRHCISHHTSRTATATAAPTPPLFPSLALGTFSLAPFAKFQWRLILQTALDLLGRIESALGLPPGSRVSTSGAGSAAGLKGGILGANIDPELVRATMHEEAERSGRRWVAEIRQGLAEMKGPLSSAIEF